MLGSSRKRLMSKTSWGSVRPRCANLEYSPVSLERKSGIPRLVEICNVVKGAVTKVLRIQRTYPGSRDDNDVLRIS